MFNDIKRRFQLNHFNKKAPAAFNSFYQSTIGSVAYFQQPITEYKIALDNYHKATDPFEVAKYHTEMLETIDAAEQAVLPRDISLIATGAFYTLSILDAVIFGGRKTVLGNYSDNIDFITYPVNNTMALGIKFKF